MENRQMLKPNMKHSHLTLDKPSPKEMTGVFSMKPRPGILSIPVRWAVRYLVKTCRFLRMSSLTSSLTDGS